MIEGKEIVIEVKNLFKKYGNFNAVDDISFEVYNGEIFGFLGANGAGKTTAIKILCGLIKPTQGIARVNSFDIYEQSEKIKKTIGYMSQKFSLYEDLTIKQNIYFFGGIYGLSIKKIREETRNLVEELNLNIDLNRQVKSIPLGWKQKLAFSIAVMHKPKIVFLDEPTGGVDPITRREFWEMIYKKVEIGMTFFVTTHYMDEAEYCDRVSIMVDGKISAIGTPKELKESFESKTFNEVFIKVAQRATRID